ncbi:hypothetical protein [Methanoplanus endosymbiosus]|uniref:Uncharacterized protein n=1 Tax=Methanoplanus endosymbiosus TaxID=33865 RepID=A0A9E7TJ19_9EURY|nr:hypothetical protein [Methanoplanus endosymbiosus]UUX93163.1 hypothetical protein L6E24_03310 [Methanoplanus endosymbiosus]
MFFDEDEEEFEAEATLESFILVMLGLSDKRMSYTVFEKMLFNAYNSGLSVYFEKRFLPSELGAASEDVRRAVEDPIFNDEEFRYTKPEEDDRLSGGYVGLTEYGRDIAGQIIVKMKLDPETITKYIVMKKLVAEHSNITDEEILLLNFRKFPKLVIRSEIYDDIYDRRVEIAGSLLKKEIISKGTYNTLVKKKWHMDKAYGKGKKS